MATLQAARAKALGLPVASAKSWGLNRAIYYAAAKRGFKGGKGPAKPKKFTASLGGFYLGDDKAFQIKAGRVTVFTIGGAIERPGDFRPQIERPFAGTCDDAWAQALRIVLAVPQ